MSRAVRIRRTPHQPIYSTCLPGFGFGAGVDDAFLVRGRRRDQRLRARGTDKIDVCGLRHFVLASDAAAEERRW